MYMYEGDLNEILTQQGRHSPSRTYPVSKWSFYCQECYVSLSHWTKGLHEDPKQSRLSCAPQTDSKFLSLETTPIQLIEHAEVELELVPIWNLPLEELVFMILEDPLYPTEGQR